MTQSISMHKQLAALGELLKLDCGDNSCLAVPIKRGMRTNGGCRCDFVAAVTELREAAVAAVDMYDRYCMHDMTIDEYELGQALERMRKATLCTPTATTVEESPVQASTQKTPSFARPAPRTRKRKTP